MYSFARIDQCVICTPNITNEYERACASVKGDLDSCYLHGCGVPMCSGVPSLYLRVLRMTVSAAFTSRSFSPHSCLGNWQYLHAKIPLGGYLIFLHPSFSLADKWIPGIPPDHFSLSLLLLSSFLLLLYWILWVYPNSIQKQAALTSLGIITESSKCPFGKDTQVRCVLFTCSEEILQLMWPLRKLHFRQKIRNFWIRAKMDLVGLQSCQTNTSGLCHTFRTLPHLQAPMFFLVKRFSSAFSL